MIGSAASLKGKSKGKSARLIRSAKGWNFESAYDNREVTTAQAIGLIGAGDFYPLTVNVIPDLAEVLFREAVAQAEKSVHFVQKAHENIRDLKKIDLAENPIPWILAPSDMDKALGSSISSIVLDIAAAEAQVNRWADDVGGWQDGEDRFPLVRKCRQLAQRHGQSALTQDVLNELGRATKRRDKFIHSKPVQEPIIVTGSRAERPAVSLSVEARKTCLTVRRSFIELAYLLKMDLPKYFAYCPATSPDDDETWGSATVMTGVRPDPDFPRTSK